MNYIPQKTNIKKADPLNSVKPSKLITFLIAYSGFMIYFAWDYCFNMQVLAPIMAIVFIVYLTKTNLSIKMTHNIKISLYISCVYITALIYGTLSDDPSVSSLSLIRVLYSIVILIYFCFVTDFNFDAKALKTILYGNIISGVFTSLLIIKNWQSGAKGKISLISFFGTGIEENYTGSFLAFVATLCFLMIIYNKDRSKKIILSFCEAFIILAMFLTGCRSATIAMALSIAVAILFYLFSNRTGTVKKIAFVFVITIVLIYVYNNAAKILPSFIYNRLFVSSLNDSSNAERLLLWEYGLTNFWNHPLIGYGVGNFAYYVSQVFTGHSVVVAHNTYIDFLLDSGIIGFALMMNLMYTNVKGIFSKTGIILLPVLVCLFFTSFIVGGERTFFLWNGLIVLTLLIKYMLKNSVEFNTFINSR